ncbi:MAG: 23S rRNA (uracil(1939)-C(5))-methyltransferase RlmD [Alysiella sp.]|uniref:23S rRNA (uracil(1939)-C(5))-methyltransferase RlmD n=1 Tax=Alysiella sp. TaxID=1872483 RepID=UPI0026DC82A8|nr:23S rRNA (uracil(1939)-C(5))-methyltransferase RlmD [Alysiella sp.]MDO4434527.1 23S rRNA (uracil(1939)-C(5))-methyltransferase RlmD [Alysiella sp.]
MNTETPQTILVTVHALDYEGRGVARVNGKTVFIEGALPLETVSARIVQRKSHFDEAQTQTIIKPTASRITPACRHYQDCGGCALQHAEFSAQVAHKQRIFEEQLQRLGKVFPAQILPPLYGAAWGYRNRTRLTVRLPENSKTAHIGFLGKRSKRVVHLHECPVLHPTLSGSLKTLHDFVMQHTQSDINAIELATADQAAYVNFITRNTLPKKALQQLSSSLNALNTADWQIWQQQGKKAILSTPKNAPPLAYKLPEFGLHIPFQPNDFTQVNQALNEIMVSRAVRLLDVKPHEKVADLFCGLGNFSLPLAKTGARVLGLEGSPELTSRATHNARANGIHNANFVTTDLFQTTPKTLATWGKFDKMLLDPPRAGAWEVVQSLHAPFLPQKIAYVSCNPATFARDAAILVQKGYRFQAAGIMNLFAQTAHIEAIGVFELISQ